MWSSNRRIRSVIGLAVTNFRVDLEPMKKELDTISWDVHANISLVSYMEWLREVPTAV